MQLGGVLCPRCCRLAGGNRKMNFVKSRFGLVVWVILAQCCRWGQEGRRPGGVCSLQVRGDRCSLDSVTQRGESRVVG